MASSSTTATAASDHISLNNNNNINNRDSRFGCNICLESVVEPVVTLCGHLYCWPCLFRWLEPGMTADEFLMLWGHDRSTAVDSSRRNCPVCKATCSVTTVVPIYVRGTHECDGHQWHVVSSKASASASASAAVSTNSSRERGETIENDDEVSSPSDRFETTTTTTTTTGVRRRLRFHQVPARPLLVSPSQQPPPIRAVQHSPQPLSTGLAMSLQQALFGTVIPPLHNYRQDQLQQEPATEFLSRVLLMLGSFVILCLLLF
ncbi:RING-type zinc-finger protein [Fragilaria crotonensis]|nr:RING-type zinc-finger protein [Fragilaria crotonensis]